jgi:hypothetical protein
VAGPATERFAVPEGPVQVVGLQPDPGQVEAEVLQAERSRRVVEDDAQSRLADRVLDAERNGDVQPVDDVVGERTISVSNRGAR